MSLEGRTYGWIPSLAADLLLIAVIVFLGLRVLRRLAPEARFTESLAAALPLGGGILTYIVFLASWAGIPVTVTSLVAAGACVLAALLVWRRSPTRRHDDLPSQGLADSDRDRSPAARRLMWAVLAAVALTSALLSVGRSYSPWDSSAIWGAKGYGIALEGTIFAAREWGAHGLAYPLNVPLLISFFKLVSGDGIPGSKLLFPLFFVSTLLGVVTFWRRRGIGDWWIAAGVLFMGSIPDIFRHSTYGYVNIALGAYLSLGTLWAVDGLGDASRGRSVVGGILLGLASWTRVEGLLYALAIATALLVSSVVTRRNVRSSLWVFPPIVILAGLWLLFYRTYGVSGSQAGGAMAAAVDGWLRGDLRLGAVRLLLGVLRRRIFDLETWGLAYPVAAVLVAIRGGRLFHRSVPVGSALALATLAAGLATGIVFYVGSFTSTDFLGWLTRGLTQAMLPVTILLMTLAITLAGSEEDAAGLGSGSGATRAGPAPDGALNSTLSPMSAKGAAAPR